MFEVQRYLYGVACTKHNATYMEWHVRSTKLLIWRGMYEVQRFLNGVACTKYNTTYMK